MDRPSWTPYGRNLVRKPIPTKLNRPVSELVDATRKAGVYEAINELQETFSTFMSPDDDRLKGDALFRIGVARAILKTESGGCYRTFDYARLGSEPRFSQWSTSARKPRCRCLCRTDTEQPYEMQTKSSCFMITKCLRLESIQNS